MRHVRSRREGKDVVLDGAPGLSLVGVAGRDRGGRAGEPGGRRRSDGLPGGDPSLTFVPPVEQWRADYVLLTPDKYTFDFLVITAPSDAHVFLDGLLLDATVCDIAPGDGLTAQSAARRRRRISSYRCQLSFPVIDPDAPNNVSPGKQNDGVHHVQADEPVGVLVYGFDCFVSYAYAGGTELREIFVP